MTGRTEISRHLPFRSTLILIAMFGLLAAFAATRADAQVYCVDKADPSCSVPHFDGDLQGALNAAVASPGLDRVLIGPGTQTSLSGFAYTDNGSDNPVEVIGSGTDQTKLTYVTTGPNGYTGVGLRLDGPTGTIVSDLKVEIPPFNDDNSYDAGVVLGQAGIARDIAVTGPNTSNVVGIQTNGASIADSSIDLPFAVPTNLGIRSQSGFPVISGTSISTDDGVVHQDPGTTTTITHSRIEAVTGARLDSGNFDISDTLIELIPASNGTGVYLGNDNNGSSTLSGTLNGVTIFGSDPSANTTGIRAQADLLSETTNLTVRNSVITGVANPMALVATHGRTTTATISHSAYDISEVVPDQGTAPDTGTVNYDHATGNIDLTGDPMFKDPANGDYTPLPASPLIDKGDPEPPTPGTTDILGNFRACNGTPGGAKIRDIGAFEYNDCIDPDTSITDGPGSVTEVTAPGFTLASSKPASTFLCSFDGGPEAACATPLTAPDLGLGTHNLVARAVDVYGNTDKTPATYEYTVVQTVGPTCETDPSLCPPVDKTPPVVKLTKKVPKKTKKKAVKVRFKSNEAGSTFTCKLNKAKAKKCKSPYKAKLRKGKNVLKVVATDKAGNRSKPLVIKIRRDEF